ncbi:hypothetical protein ATO12_22840 [Aquimarina atlantica]|uniref:Acyltransferase 3 domain-containing protein n=1 Tax=Aquimarina atlantica TaxID=1317122 RepID=A0A023BQF3_9FLAO|nr:acyltransferase [Aquimarina atlantica]EZH72292.1 hypothetical protein ATO12_22840 [Aquimarina atlantica]
MRIEELDYLRGLMAVVIMIYHYFSWSFGAYDSSSILGIMGIYGVSIFYVLSGLTLFVVYKKKLMINTLISFFIKRFFRIYPLLWLCVFLEVFLLENDYSLQKMILNITGVFGFIAPDQYISTGAWSIGNELVFYSFFPVIVLFSSKYKRAVEFFFIVSLVLAIYFAFFQLNSNDTLGNQWKTYINPFNQLFLFVGGIYLAKLIGNNEKNNKLAIVLLVIAITLLLFYPLSGDQINIVTNWNRLFLSGCSFIIVAAFLIMRLQIARKIDLILGKLGHISYSIYLLHPIIYSYMTSFIDNSQNPIFFIILCFVLTFVLSLITYEVIESNFMSIGKYLSIKTQKFSR